MTSVSAVAAADIRQNFSAQPSTASEDPFSLLLDAVADVNIGVAQETPQPERRDDVPAQSVRPEAEHRQAKRRAPEGERAEKPKAEANAAPQEVADDESVEETETTEGGDDGEDALIEALLSLSLGETQEQAPPPAPLTLSADAAAQNGAPAAALQVAVAAEIEAAPLPALTAAINAEAAEVQALQNAPASAGLKLEASLETAIAPLPAAEEAEVALPEISAGGLAKLLKPLKALPAAAEAAADAKPISVEATATIPSRALAHLETLNAALSKHFQLTAAVEADAPAPDAQKPVFPGNGVLPNLALAIQPATTVTAQAQAAVETARTVPLESLAVEIATRARNGERRFDIRLDPPELGRIDVRLEIDHKGNTSTKLIVERAETLDMLQRDARGLEKALQSAGLKTDAGGLEFSLRQDAQTQQNQPNAPQGPQRPDLLAVEEDVSAQIALGNATLAAQLRGGVDIRI